jgi:hypothetical protein
MKRIVAAWLVLLPAAALADEVFLNNGRQLSGVIVERKPDSLTLQVGPGRLTIPMSLVARIEVRPSALAEFQERAQRLAPGDAPGWLTLALWAQERGLLTQARSAFERVLAVDPQNAAAQQALGNVRLGDRWVSPEESQRARGYVLYEGSWMTPEERDARIADDAARARVAAERAKAEAEAREADIRVREAEARAREAEAREREAFYGVPFPIGGPVTPCVFPCGCAPCPPPPCPRPDPAPPQNPPPSRRRPVPPEMRFPDGHRARGPVSPAAGSSPRGHRAWGLEVASEKR